MTQRPGHNARPTMLVLCACMPEPTGEGVEQRAWSLLQTMRATYHVTLAVTTRGRVHLSQWRRLAEVADRVEMLPAAGLWGRVVRSLSHWANRSTATVYSPPVRFEAMTRRYDAALCIEPRWWPVLRTIDADTLMCDLYDADAATSDAIARHADVVLPSASQAATTFNWPARAVVRTDALVRTAPSMEVDRLVETYPTPMPLRIVWRPQPATAPARLAA
jgi:hypothetical protein